MTYDTFYKLVYYFESKGRQGDILHEKIYVAFLHVMYRVAAVNPEFLNFKNHTAQLNIIQFFGKKELITI
jgi:hypothetical protein